MFAQLGCDVLSTTDVARVLDDNTDSKPQWRLYRLTLAENLSRTANCIQYALQHIFSVAEMHSSLMPAHVGKLLIVSLFRFRYQVVEKCPETLHPHRFVQNSS